VTQIIQPEWLYGFRNSTDFFLQNNITDFNPPSRSASADEKAWFNSPMLCIGNLSPEFYSGV
jgi:hypothetical protein